MVRSVARRASVPPLALAVLLAGCAGGGQRPLAPSQVDVPGEQATVEQRAVGAGGAALQDMPPVERFDAYLCGFHFASGDPSQQVEAHHYVQRINEDFLQSVIYDGNDRAAKLVGVEYLISERLFRTLPPEEQRLWHSHGYEVASGTLIAPGLPQATEHALMKDLAETYGKTWSFWQVERGDTLPLGAPRLMMSFTATGQLDPQRLADRDRRFGTSSEVTREERAELDPPAPSGQADAWERGEAYQVELAPLGDTTHGRARPQEEED